MARVTREPRGFNERQFLVLVTLAGVGLGMTAPLTVLYAASFGASDTLAGLAVSSVAISLLAIDTFGTKLVPRVNGRFTMCFSMVVFGLGSIASASAGELWQMIAARVSQGVGAAFFLGGALQLMVRFAPRGGAGRAIGVFNAAWFGGVGVGPLVGGLLASSRAGQAGYRLAFVVCGVVCFAVALLAWFRMPSISSSRPPRLSIPRRPAARPGLRMWPPLTLAAIGQIVRGGLMLTVIPLFGKRGLGLNTATVGVAMSCLAAVDLVAMRVGGSLADRIGPRRVLLWALVSGFVLCAMTTAVDNALSFVVWCAALGVVTGVTWVVPIAVTVDVAQVAEDGLSAYRIGADVGQLVGSIGAGAIVALSGFAGAAVVFGAGFAAIAAWVVRLPETARPQVAHDVRPSDRPSPSGVRSHELG